MGKKVALNVLYNVGIIVCLFIAYEGYLQKHWSWVLGAVFVAVMLIILKVRLIKEVRQLTKKR